MTFSFQKISFGYQGNTLFENVGYCLDEGGLLTIKGANGSGKTTLLKILTGLIVPEDGFIFYGDMEISEDYRSYFRNMQYLGHRNAVDPELTVKENLQLWAGMAKNAAALEPVFQFFKLEEVLNKQCKYLSAGWNRRVALARLMVKRVNLWILDEPFANLDEEIIEMTLKMIATFCDQRGKVIMSCHKEVDIPFGANLYIEDFRN